MNLVTKAAVGLTGLALLAGCGKDRSAEFKNSQLDLMSNGRDLKSATERFNTAIANSVDNMDTSIQLEVLSLKTPGVINSHLDKLTRMKHELDTQFSNFTNSLGAHVVRAERDRLVSR